MLTDTESVGYYSQNAFGRPHKSIRKKPCYLHSTAEDSLETVA